MKFRLWSLFAFTGLFALLMVPLSPKAHPNAVVSILDELANVSPDADLRTAITTLLQPIRPADDSNEDEESKTYFVYIEKEYCFVLNMNKTEDGLLFDSAYVLKNTKRDKWKYLYPIRQKNELEWQTKIPPVDPTGHYPASSWGCCSFNLDEQSGG